MTLELIVATLIALALAAFSGWLAWALRRVRTNDLHAIRETLKELKKLNREDHEKFFTRIGKLETAVGKLNVKVGIE